MDPKGGWPRRKKFVEGVLSTQRVKRERQRERERKREGERDGKRGERERE